MLKRCACDGNREASEENYYDFALVVMKSIYSRISPPSYHHAILHRRYRTSLQPRVSTLYCTIVTCIPITESPTDSSSASGITPRIPHALVKGKTHAKT